jgi:hypothetical protein
MSENRPLLRAALRVLANLEYRMPTAACDIDLLRCNALSEEVNLDLDDLARSVALRVMERKTV